MTAATNNDFVRDCWYVAGWDYEFSADTLQARLILDEPIVLFRKSDGRLVALADRCVHRHAPLSMGRIEGDFLRCMYHGLRFSTDGKCVEIPGQEQIPAKACVHSYAVVEKGSWAWVWMGEPSAADPALIPPVRGFDAPEWVLKSGTLDYAAPYQLINDNLLDLSHLAYVHANSFGATGGWSSRPPVTTALERGVRVERWVESAPPIPPLPALACYDTIDLWVTYDFYVPGVFIMYTATYPAGTALLSKHGAPSGKPLFSNFTCQAVTAQTANTSRTFFSWGPGSEFGGEEIAEQMIAVATLAFNEDKTIIEAQAQVIARAPELSMMATSADKAVGVFQRIIDKLKRPAGSSAAA
jgi:phenylpropionate dioxygenase-like ring-hydroxylating dioxygenase large terminal subunit